MAGTCRAGDGCSYSHDRSISNRGTLPCRFYRSGTCANGSNCRFSHGDVTESSTTRDLTVVMSRVSLDPTSTPYVPTCVQHSPNPPASSQQYMPPICSSSSQHQADLTPKYQTLRREVSVGSPGVGRGWVAPTNWADAPEFVPTEESVERSWAQVVNPKGGTRDECQVSLSDAESQLCPFYLVGECRYGSGCAYIHGDTCQYCAQPALHPHSQTQRKTHLAQCLQQHERDMELSFAVARSKEKTCGICMEVVLDKPKGEARFGILPACNHCFCLPCIRKWRQAKQFEHKIIRACPECRQKSDYICPSRFWVETTEEKDLLLADYKKALGGKECKYFNKGEGECPFGNKCFYRHAGQDGRDVDVGPPKKPVRRANADGNLTLVQRLLLYDFLEEREERLVLPLEYIELLDLFSDSDDWSESDD